MTSPWAQQPPRRFIPIAWQGTWTPARFHLSDVMLVLWAATFQPGFRGFDYVTGGESSQSLTQVERVMPLDVWGGVFLFGAVVLGTGMTLRRHFTVWLGHSILTIAYAAIGVGIFVQSIGQPPWFDGIRGSTVLSVVTLVHAIYWYRTGPRPRTRKTDVSNKPRPDITHILEAAREAESGGGVVR